MTPYTEWIPMRQRELQRYHTVRLVGEQRITGAEAAQNLALSRRNGSSSLVNPLPRPPACPTWIPENEVLPIAVSLQPALQPLESFAFP